MDSPGFEGRIAWNGVRVEPGAAAAFRTETSASHYYEARRAAAAPLQVGSERERFLFYRGIGTFELPLRATVSSSGDVEVIGVAKQRVPAVVLFTNRRGRIGYEVRTAPSSRIRFEPPELDGNLETLGMTLERLLVAQGLYAKEAAAMVATWRDSWFEEGTRLFYIVPQPLVDAVLPLEISPRPADVSRVFVGRLELVTADTLTELEIALRTHDRARLARFGRFMRPFADRLLARPITAAERERIERLLTAASF